jgi:hypothetical protein
MEKTIYLTFASDIESSDVSRRIIAGVVLPFNKIGNTSAGPVMFESGSVQIPEARRVKLLAQHSQNDPIGRALNFQVTQDQIFGTFKVSASSKGTDYLTLAAEELISSLSIGVDVLKAKENADGVLVVSSAVMKEVSLVESPAYADAIVTKVAASESETEEVPTQPTTESEAILDVKAPEPTDTPAEATTPTVEAARPIITAPYNSQTVRHGITSMGRYTEHKIKASLGNDESRLWVQAADDSFTTNPAFSPNQYLRNVVSNTNFGRSTIDACTKAALPSEGMNVIVPTLVTSAGGGNGVAPVVTVEAEAGAVQNTGMVTEYMTATVAKYAGMNTMSIELIERSGPAFYDQLTLQLQRAYLKATNQAVITK